MKSNKANNFCCGIAAVVAFMFTVCLHTVSFAKETEIPYDKYTSELRAAHVKGESLEERLSGAPAAPVNFIKKGIDKALILVEKYHLVEKYFWLMEKLNSWGIYPKGQALQDEPTLGIGVLLGKEHWISRLGLPENVDFYLQSQVTSDAYHEHGAHVSWDEMMGSSFFTSADVRYESRPSEEFFGIGPNSILANSYNYDVEFLRLDTSLGRHVTKQIDVEVSFAYTDVKISNGHDADHIALQDAFTPAQLKGSNGGDYVTLGTLLMRDTRDSKINPKGGDYQKLSAFYNTSSDSSDFNYWKFRAEFARFIPIWSKRRILAIHVAGEHNKAIGQEDIPFFDLAMLGGGTTLRGYRFNRFRDESSLLMNLEYRYNIWQFKKASLDVALFFDLGQVFGEISEFKLDNFKESYGMAFRFFYDDAMMFDVEVGHGDEGTRLFIKYSYPF